MSQNQSIKSTLASAISQLNTKEATPEAQLLLQHVLNVNRAWLIAHEHESLLPSIHEAFRAVIERRLNGEPIAYILGYREFYGLNLKVTPDTLIPRPDTETLVEATLTKIPQNDNTSSPSFRRKLLDFDFRRNDTLKILDLGTGTGAIALAIAKHRPQAFFYAVDTSQAALDVAIENARNLEISNVKFILSDWFSALGNEKFDIIVSNPPYIETDDAHLKQGDLRFEPISALASGEDGLDDIRKILQEAPQHLSPNGCLLLEHGHNQAEVVAALLKQAGFTEIGHAQDLAGIQRVTLGSYGAASRS
jgi:release factor glutamine methyltransferase